MNEHRSDKEWAQMELRINNMTGRLLRDDFPAAGSDPDRREILQLPYQIQKKKGKEDIYSQQAVRKE